MDELRVDQFDLARPELSDDHRCQIEVSELQGGVRPIEHETAARARGITHDRARHPELSHEALTEIGRCVGWQLR